MPDYTKDLKPFPTKRLEALDGLRAIAALGVLWIHVWTLHGNPRLFIAGFDITQLLAIGGNGVDLFFVISGFCMYYFYAGNTQFSYSDFVKFLKRRWIRLSPAFYTATVVYMLFRWDNLTEHTVLPQLLTSIFYLNSISNFNVEGFFWSLGAEWQFYLLIPFLLIYQNRVGFTFTFLIISMVLFITAVLCVFILKSKSDIITDQIIFRYFEFAWGIILARFMLLKKPNLKYRYLWLIFFIFLTYSGRILLSKYILSFSELYYNIFRLAGFIIMCLGFAGIIYLAITSKKWLLFLLGNPFLSFMGKISYSFYLWHGLANMIISRFIITTFNIQGFLAPAITFFICTLTLLPVSYLSFRILEKPFYLKK